MEFDKSLFSEGLALLRRNMPFVAFAVFGEYAHQALKQITHIGSGHFVVSILIWSYLAHAAHADILLPDAGDKKAAQKRILGFTARTFGLCLAIFAPVVLVVWFVVPATVSGDSIQQYMQTLVLIALPTLIISALLVLTLLGTVLPAYVADTGRGVNAAFARGTNQFRQIMPRLIYGPGFVMAAAVLVFSLPGLLFDAAGPILAANYVPNPVPTTAALIGFAIEAYALVLTALILSKAFLYDQQ